MVRAASTSPSTSTKNVETPHRMRHRRMPMIHRSRLLPPRGPLKWKTWAKRGQRCTLRVRSVFSARAVLHPSSPLTTHDQESSHGLDRRRIRARVSGYLSDRDAVRPVLPWLMRPEAGGKFTALLRPQCRSARRPRHKRSRAPAVEVGLSGVPAGGRALNRRLRRTLDVEGALPRRSHQSDRRG